MRTSESIGKLAEALAKAQGEFGEIKKTKTNTYFKNSRYAPLSEVLKQTIPALSKNGICFIQSPRVENGLVTITTKLVHVSEEWIETELPLRTEGDTPQKVGSCITYGRRYSACAILGVDGEDDDDGEVAEGRGLNESNSQPPTQKNIPQAKQEIPKERIYLAATYKERDEAKALGGKWDSEAVLWYCDDPNNKALLDRFGPPKPFDDQDIPPPDYPF